MLEKRLRKIEAYLNSHTTYNALIHICTGVGIGILLTHPLLDPHPLRWGFAFLAIGILGHIYPLLKK